MSKNYRIASLFCGCGGSDLGAIGGFTFIGKKYKKLPFKIVYAVDFDKPAIETYNANFEHQGVCKNILDVDAKKEIPEIDILMGGFPCQSFSTVNPTKDTNDARANLYKEIVRILHEKKPKIFVCENVKGLLTLQGGAIIKKISSFQWFVIIYVLMTLVTVFRLDSTGLGSHLILYSILYMGASGFLDIIEYAYVSIALFLISTTLWGIAFWRLAVFCFVIISGRFPYFCFFGSIWERHHRSA